MAMTQLYETKFIEQAMTSIGLCDKVDTLLDVLDKMELDRKLNKSIEEADRGEGRPVEDFLKEWDERIANGYYEKDNVLKRIREREYARGA
jgi:hypothetical protein